MCHVSCRTEPAPVDADAKHYATCEYDDPTKPVYTPADNVLELKRSVRFAAIDVMILVFAARRHAEWLSEIGICPPDIAKLIRKDLAYITSVLPPEAGTDAPPTPSFRGLGDVRPRSPGPSRATTPTPTLFNATHAKRGDVGETGPNEVITGEA